VNTASPPARDSRLRRFRIAVISASVIAAIVGSALLATRDSGEKVTTRGVTATLSVPGHPGSVVAGPDALWVALNGDLQRPVSDRPLLRLDLASGAVQRSVFLGGQASYLTRVGSRLVAAVSHVEGDGLGQRLIALDWRSGRVLVRRAFDGSIGSLAEGGKDLWALQVQPGTLLRLDPLTLAPTAPPLRLSQGRTLGVAMGIGYVWVTAAEAGEVLRIDPASRAITSVHVGGFPVGIVVAGGRVWFADRERGDVVGLEPRTLRPIGEPIHVGSDPSWMGTAGGYLFVANPDSGTVTRIDMRLGKKAGRPIRVAEPAKDAPAFAIAPAGTSVWVSSFASNTLTRISAAAAAPAAVSSAQPTTVAHALPRGGEVVARIAVPPTGGGFAVGEGAVWAMSDLESTLLRIDPRRNTVDARIKVEPSGAAAAGNGALWLSHPGDNTVSRIYSRTNRVTATIPVGPQPDGIAVSSGAIWVANAGGPSVSRIDPDTNRVVATIRVGPARACCSDHMSVTVGGGAVWVAVPNLNTIVRLDPVTNAVIARVKLAYPPCGFMVADEAAVWSASGGCGEVVGRIDADANVRSGSVDEPHAVGVAFGFGSLWVAVLGLKAVDRVDPLTGRIVARLPVGGLPIRIGVGFGSVWVYDDEGRVLRIRPGD
jgi:virginiamycin B lyase